MENERERVMRHADTDRDRKYGDGHCTEHNQDQTTLF